MNETTTADYLQLPDFPLTYPAPVSFVLRKLEMVRSELVRMINDGSVLAGVVMSVNGKAPDESKNVSLAASDVPATEKVDGTDVQTTVQARLDDTASEIAAHEARTDNPHNVTAKQTGARSLADLAVYEEKDGKVEKTDDAFVKKSEVTDEYSDLWVLETGEVVELYFTWVEDNEYFWLSNFEGWDGSKGSEPPSFPAYYTTVLDVDAKAISETLLTCRKDTSEASITLKATRRVKKNALGLACVGDNVSEFANDAGYVTTDDVYKKIEVDAKIEIMQSELSSVDRTLAGSISSIDTEISNLAQASTVDTISQRVDVLSAKVDSANAALEEVV